MNVSVIVPVYNAQDYLCECLDSILNQSYADIEVVVVDDGSTDESSDICDRYAMQDKRVHVVHTENHGLSVARNTGVEAATGDFVMFVDSDDIIHRDTVGTLMRAMTDNAGAAAVYGFAYGSPDNMSADGDITTYQTLEIIEKILYQTRFYNSLCTMLLPRQALLAEPQTPGILYEDLDAFYRIIERIDGCIVAIDAPMYYYRATPSSILHVFDKRRLVVLDITDRIERHYADNQTLLGAARDRKFSANFNMFLLCSRYGLAEQAERCWQVIRQYRWSSLTNNKVRLKNRVGALVSYLGPRAMRLLDKIAAMK